MGLDDFPRPPTTQHRGMTASSSQSNNSRRHDRNYSPPSTPPSNGRKQQSQRQQWPQPRTLNTGYSYPETFLDDTTPVEQLGRPSESADEQDPHDLALSPKHVTRTSVVDNMLLSLDQFTPGSPLFSDTRFFNDSPEPDPYLYSSNNHRFSLAQQPRFRSHTLSSSVSSDIGPGPYGDDDYPQIPRSSGRRSNGSTSHPTSQRRQDTARSRDSAGSGYPRNYDLDEEIATPPHVPSRRHAARQESKGSTDSVDYDRTFEEHYLNYSHRRSMSLDYGSRPAYLSNPLQGSELILDDLDAAPTPTVPPGPRRDPSSGLPGSLPPPRAPALSRRNSNRSARSTATRKGRPETLGTSTIKYNDETPRPPLPSSFIDPSAPSPTISYQKPPMLPLADATPAKEKQGFFRRVFGSSKASSEQSTPEQSKLPTPKSDNPPTPSQPRQEPAHPVVAKKASSFFRRRKKSVVDSIPPPLNLAPNVSRGLDMRPEPSPASSLRQVMDPYLSSKKAAKNNAEDYSTETQEHSPSHLRTEHSFLEDTSSRPKLRQSRTADGSNNALPMAKKSENEASSSTRYGSQRENRPQTSPVGPLGNATANSQPPVPEKQLQVNTSKNLIPPSEIQNSSFLHSGTSPNNSSRGSLRHESSVKSNLSASDASQYHTASNSPMIDTPIITTIKSPEADNEESENAGAEGSENMPSAADREKARQLFNDPDEVVENEPAAWLGDVDRAMVRKAYMELFNWTNMDILAALRSLCTKMALKGETQQVDRVLDALSTRWCECNPNHGFKAVDVVHTICYSLLLLNTDLHMADIEQKMTRNQFVRNTLPTINRVASDAAPDGFDTIRASGNKSRAPLNTAAKSPTLPQGELTLPPPETETKARRTSILMDGSSSYGPLISTPFQGTIKAWEAQIEIVLKDFYNSIQKQRLPLYNAPADSEGLAPPTTTTGNILRRSPSVLSKTGSDIIPRGRSADSRMTTGRWSSKPRSRARLYPASTMGSSRTSLDDQSSVWSPSASSTWSKYSLGKTMTSMSVDSLGSEYHRGGYQQSIGFANALSHAIIREDAAHSISSYEDPGATKPLLEDDTLELLGAPWAKEGSLKHKQHLEAVDKKAKDRNWNECFAVIQRGWLRLFSFSANSKSMRLKSKQRQGGGVVVGGGNWMENAEEVWKFLLRQTIASALPPPGYSKSRPHVWALSLPTGAVHLFQVGTAEIVREFVTTANYWSARLSKQPLVGGISNMEYGWSDAVINSALINMDYNRSPPNSSGTGPHPPPRPSFQSSIRSSLDQQGGVRAKLPADRVHLSDWTPPQQSMNASTLSEADQLSALQTYVKNVEEDLQKHNELRPAMLLAFSPRHPNAAKAMSNWERKSSYLLREIVKFRTYIDCLTAAKTQKEKIYAEREAEINAADAAEDENDEGDDTIIA
ncbi:hypothetical protein DPV78_007778 [Talaromyces pinophilus]|nr:hypothetical protein DPV78_007778 [Talaromyces pinophilus]